MEGEQKKTFRISDMRNEDKPRERMAALGSSALSSRELLAILLRVGTKGENVLNMADRLLNSYGGLQGLHSASFAELCAEHGMGVSKTAQLKAALELGHRLKLEELKEKPVINSPGDVADLVMHELSAARQEHLWVLMLNTRNHVLNIQRLYTGSLNHSTVRIGEVFEAAIRHKAAGIIVVHNHPSGDPSPSPEDIQLTTALIKAGDLLDIKLLDHIIIGSREFVSLKQRKLGFE
jgi:DNA repair protein RadC